MFDNTLLESSLARAPILTKGHYFFATGCGLLAFLPTFFTLRRLFPVEQIRVPAIQSLIIGAFAAAFVLMLCYVHADARHMGLNAAFWLAVTALLNVVGFIGYLIYSAARIGDWRRAAIPCAYICEVILGGGMALVPLIYTEALPKVSLIIWSLPIPPPPPAAPAEGRDLRKPLQRTRTNDLLKAPPSIPTAVRIVHDEPLPPPDFSPGPTGVPGGVSFGPSNASDPALRSVIASTAPQPLPPQEPRPARIRVGGVVSAAKLIYQPKPTYPEFARMARAEGAVEFEAIIGKDGRIEELKLLGGPALLVHAAFEAVQRWRYQPTLLNGEPVEVLTEITVNFKLRE